MNKSISTQIIRLCSVIFFVAALMFFILFRVKAVQTHYTGDFSGICAGFLCNTTGLLTLGVILIFGFSFIYPKLITGVLLMIISVAFTFSMAEIYLRQTQLMFTAWELRGNSYYSYFDYKPAGRYIRAGAGTEHWLESSEYKYWRPTNTYGFGEYDLDSIFALKGIKLMALGDSFTEGGGTSYDSSWIKQLGAMLNEKNTTGNRVIAVNAGISGSDPVNSVSEFKNELVCKYQPDIAILAINHSDFHDIKTRGGFERYLPDGTVVYPKAPWWEPYYAASHLFRLIIHNVFDLDFNFVSKKEYQKNIPLYTRHIEEACCTFIETCKRNKIQPVIVMTPLMFEVANRQWVAEMDLLKQKIEKMPDVLFVNVLDYYINNYADTVAPQQMYWVYDFHCNSKGYKIIAEAVMAKIAVIPCLNNPH